MEIERKGRWNDKEDRSGEEVGRCSLKRRGQAENVVKEMRKEGRGQQSKRRKGIKEGVRVEEEDRRKGRI